jgi:hypothetical protein
MTMPKPSPVVPYRAPDPALIAAVRAAIERHKLQAYQRAVNAVRNAPLSHDLPIMLRKQAD